MSSIPEQQNLLFTDGESRDLGLGYFKFFLLSPKHKRAHGSGGGRIPFTHILFNLQSLRPPPLKRKSSCSWL